MDDGILTSHAKVELFNLQVNVMDRPSLFRELARRLIVDDGQISINFLNAHCFNIAQQNVEYRNALQRSTYLLNDGVGIDIAARLSGFRFKENLNGTDLIPEMLGMLAELRMPVYLYGARPTVIEKAVAEIRKLHPSLPIAGYSDGYVADVSIVIDRINNSGATALILGLGVPLQELWVDKHGRKLAKVRLCVSGGAIFDFLSGRVVRAPKVIRQMRLEWMFRLVMEPIRLFSRYVFGNFLFLYHILVGFHRK